MVTYLTIVILVAFLAGYVLGKHCGWHKGYNKAQAVVPLEMRQQSLEQGRCVICEGLWTETRKCENYRRELDTL
ncbi:MAG: hypothetical protein H6Q72_1824 [Firmicutes bacterium]|nr:hypothetical protein [Bacillota bacterium]